MLCNVTCNFRCKVLVLSRYCTVDGTFLCLLYVSNVQKRFIVSLFILYELRVYLYIVNVLITIRMLFLGKKNCHCFIEKCAVYESICTLLISFLSLLFAFLWF